MRANDLFRWLRDCGVRLGGRQTGTGTKLQQEANQGVIGLIVARRKEDGKSGHIVAVVPETVDDRAKRNSAGDVAHPAFEIASADSARQTYAKGSPPPISGKRFRNACHQGGS